MEYVDFIRHQSNVDQNRSGQWDVFQMLECVFLDIDHLLIAILFFKLNISQFRI